MVHALGEIRRVLVPGGRLVDFRPLGTHWPLEVSAADQVRLAGLVNRDPGIRDDAACEHALAQALNAGWFVHQWQETFEFVSTWEALNEVDGPGHLPEATTAEAQRLLAEMGDGARVHIRFNNVITRYGKPRSPK